MSAQKLSRPRGMFGCFAGALLGESEGRFKPTDAVTKSDATEVVSRQLSRSKLYRRCVDAASQPARLDTSPRMSKMVTKRSEQRTREQAGITDGHEGGRDHYRATGPLYRHGW